MLYCRQLSIPNFVGNKQLFEQFPTSKKMEDMDSIYYDIVSSRLNITQVAGALSQFMDNSRCEHWVAMNSVFKYFQGTFEDYIYRDMWIINRKYMSIEGDLVKDMCFYYWWISELDEQEIFHGDFVHCIERVYGSESFL